MKSSRTRRFVRAWLLLAVLHLMLAGPVVYLPSSAVGPVASGWMPVAYAFGYPFYWGIRQGYRWYQRIPFEYVVFVFILNSFLYGFVGACALPIVHRWFRPGSVRSGLCERCGYDLRGTAKGARCPECGKVCAQVAD